MEGGSPENESEPSTSVQGFTNLGRVLSVMREGGKGTEFSLITAQDAFP